MSGCGNIPSGLTAVDMRVEQQALQATYPDAVGFAFVDPLNSGLVLNLDGTGTYIRNSEDPNLSHEYIPFAINSMTSEAICFGLGCMSLSRTTDGRRVCDIDWDNGNKWQHMCKLVAIPAGFDVRRLNRPGL